MALFGAMAMAGCGEDEGELLPPCWWCYSLQCRAYGWKDWPKLDPYFGQHVIAGGLSRRWMRRDVEMLWWAIPISSLPSILMCDDALSPKPGFWSTSIVDVALSVTVLTSTLLIPLRLILPDQTTTTKGTQSMASRSPIRLLRPPRLPR